MYSPVPVWAKENGLTAIKIADSNVLFTGLQVFAAVLVLAGAFGVNKYGAPSEE